MEPNYIWLAPSFRGQSLLLGLHGLGQTVMVAGVSGEGVSLLCGRLEKKEPFPLARLYFLMFPIASKIALTTGCDVYRMHSEG